MSEKRLETFVFEFDNNEVFRDFFQKYYPLEKDKLITGMRCLGVGTGNFLKKEDELVELIGTLYDIATRVPINKDIRDRALLKTEKLLGIN